MCTELATRANEWLTSLSNNKQYNVNDDLTPVPKSAPLPTATNEKTMPSGRSDSENIFQMEMISKSGKEIRPLMKETEVNKKTMLDDTSQKQFSPLLRQSLGMAGPFAAIISSGMTSGFSAILLPQLHHEDSTISITQDQASWIASMAALPMALGCIVSGLFIERYGRKLSHQLLCVPFVVGWVLLSVANNVDLLYVGRFLTGFCVGLIGPCSTVFIAEMSGPEYRGVFLAVVSLGIALGILVAHALGTYLTWRLTAAVSSAFPALCFCIVSAVPESPAWLAAQGRIRQAEEAFRWFRGYDAPASAELSAMLVRSASQRETDRVNQQNKKTWSEFRKLLLDSSFMQPFMIMNAFFFILQFSGVNAIAFYTVSILKDVGLGIDEYVATLAIDGVRAVMSVVACVLLRRFGRRPLSIVSGIGTALSLLGLAGFLRYAKGEPNLDLAWLPMVFLICYICFISVGYVPLPWVMIGEVFPSKARGIGSGASSCFGFLVFFVVVKIGPGMFATLGSDGAFMTYGIVAAAGTVFLYFFLPETRNRTLQDIEDKYKNKNSCQKDAADKILTAA